MLYISDNQFPHRLSKMHDIKDAFTEYSILQM